MKNKPRKPAEKASPVPLGATESHDPPAAVPKATPEEENALYRRLLRAVIHDLDAISLTLRRTLG